MEVKLTIAALRMALSCGGRLIKIWCTTPTVARSMLRMITQTS